MPTLHVVAGPNGCGESTPTRTTWFSGVEVGVRLKRHAAGGAVDEAFQGRPHHRRVGSSTLTP